MLLRTLKSLFSQATEETAETIEAQVLRLLREKKPATAKEILSPYVEVVAPVPEHLALMGEIEFHLKNHETAEQLCLDALRRKPSLAGAHYVLSIIYTDLNRNEEAMAQAMCARNLAPAEARFLAQMGLCCIALQNYGLARDTLRQVALIDPDNVPALNNLGIAHHALTEHENALYCFQRALDLKPEYEPARENLRNLYGVESFSSRFDSETNMLDCHIDGLDKKQPHYSPEEEVRIAEALEEQLDTYPEDPSFAVQLLQHYLKTFKLEEAADILRIALAQHPESATILVEAGRMAQTLGQLNRARENFAKAIELDPVNVKALLGLGQVLRDLERVEEALVPIEKAASLEETANTLTQLAFAQVNACQYEPALATCMKIESSYPNLTPFLNSTRAVSLTYLGRFDEARAYLGGAQGSGELNPSHATFLGMIELLHENYAQGWDGYRYRLLNDVHRTRLLPYQVWQGEDLHNKTILVLAEQGLGDQVMFASCLPDLIALGPRRIVMEAHSRVSKTLARSFPDVTVFPSGQRGFAWLPSELQPDCYVHIADLSWHFRKTREAFPQHQGYLVPDPERVAYWKARLDESNSLPKIGFTWRGGVQQTRRTVRSMELEDLLPLLSAPGLQFVNLQYGSVQEELEQFANSHGLQLIDWPESIKDLDEFAALISALDLVITVCNTTVHYTGALNKPCWVMTPFIPEWRYGLVSERMSWYPSTRMFRQSSNCSWQEVIHDVLQAVNEVAKQQHKPIEH